MLRFNILNIMQKHCRQFCGKAVVNGISECSYPDYENTIAALNTLQSNAEYLKIAGSQRLTHPEEFSKTILQTQKYLKRSGLSLEVLDKLPVIHVTGTKGKGSTCALCENILRHHGLRTGFYSSPHLLEVRERIRINGVPIQKQAFVKYFWNIFNKLDNNKMHSNDMPIYFTFLTIMAFTVFLKEKVDVAIIEVGIGGEYDSTNILRNVPVAGITSLGLDHVRILGNSIEEIAWHKSGIMKEGSKVFTVPQPNAAIQVLINRSIERNCSLKVVEPLSSLPISNDNVPFEIASLNVSLACEICHTWLNLKNKQDNATNIIHSPATKSALLDYEWPGRFQILHAYNNTFYLDGAHTADSIRVCAKWFTEKTKTSKHKNVLLFNTTGDRNSKDMLKILKTVNFNKVFFIPNKAVLNDKEDNKNFNVMEEEIIARCYQHHKIWNDLNQTRSADLVIVLPSVSHVLQHCRNDVYNFLITGSLHLVGSTLSLIDKDLKDVV